MYTEAMKEFKTEELRILEKIRKERDTQIAASKKKKSAKILPARPKTRKKTRIGYIF